MIYWTGVVYLGVSGGRAQRGVLGRPHRILDEEPTGLLAALGTLCLGEEPLAVLAALDMSMSQVLVMTFFPGLLSGFLVYLYTWFCFPNLSSSEKRMQSFLLEAFIQGLVTR